MPTVFAAVPEEWKGSRPIATPGGSQEMLCLTEQGLYFFLGRSDKPKALPYQKWVAGEIMPSIRQTGKFESSKSLPNRAHTNLTDIIHMGNAIDYSRTLRQMARLKNYSPAQRLGFLAEAASVLSGLPAEHYLPEEFDSADIPDTVLYNRPKDGKKRPGGKYQFPSPGQLANSLK